MFGILFFLAVIPVIIICTYIYRKDKNKEPGGLLVKLFLLGIASCFLTLLLSEVVFKIFPFMEKGTEAMSFFEIMAYAFIGVALVEEFCKWIMVYFSAYSNREFDEVYDGIVYAVYASLGFAFFENLLYVFGNLSITVGITRGLLAVPGHACDAVFMGYYLSLAKVYSYQGRKDLEKKNIILSVLVPTILHGIYDFCLFSGQNILIITFLIFVISLYIISIGKIKELAAQSPARQTNTYNNQNYQNNYRVQYATNNMYGQNQQYNNVQNINQNNYSQQSYQNQSQKRFCSNCGNLISGSNFCSKCGTRQN